MRVITGSARGRKLKDLEGMDTRPTAGRVKEAIFSAIQFDIEGRRVLDLFAGTGQLGIEALSRGAAAATLIDQRRAAAAVIRENLRLTQLESRAEVINGDAFAFLQSTNKKFGLIFIDPPFAAGLWENALKAISRFDILTDHGIIICESPADEDMPDLPSPYCLHRVYRYGQVKVTSYYKEASSAV